MNAPRGPLSGVRVVYPAALGPVPFASMLLADMGADVIRIDRVGATTEVTGLDLADDPRSRGHRGIGIDLKSADGLELARTLIARADVFVEAMRPGVAERLGLGPEELRARDPRLIYGRMTGWGREGPFALRAGHDINYLSMAGGLYPLGSRETPPAVPLNLVADFGGGGMYLVMGVLAALFARSTSGQGQVIDCAMVDGVASLTAMFHGMLASGSWTDQRESNLLDGAAPFYRTYRTSDGGFMAVGALEPQFYAALLAGLRLDPAQWPQQDRSRWKDQSRQLAELFATRTREEWTTVFEGTDACVTPVLSLLEAANSEALRSRGTFVEWDGLVQPAPAPRLSAAPVTYPGPRSARYSHTAEILAELGHTPDRITSLAEAGIIA